MLINRTRVLLVMLVSITLITSSMVQRGYSYWNDSNDSISETIPVGLWTYVPLPVGLDFAADLSGFIDNELGLDPNSDFQYIYSQENMPQNTITTISDIDVFGYSWNFWGKIKNANYPTLGYPVVIDRSLNEFGDPVHDIAPTYSSTPLYPEYNYFVAYDANNLHTNNQYSLRLNYNNRMTTTTPIGQVTNVSFYAAIGLADPDDAVGIRDNQRLYVEVSPNSTSWTRISANVAIPQVSSENEYFSFYSYDVTGSLLGQNLYVRIRYNGRTLIVNGEAGFGRLIIDDLVITTN